MDYSYKIQMEQKLKKLFDKGMFINRQVVIFGSNEPAEQMIDVLETLDVQVKFLLDNNKKKAGMFLKKIPIKKPEDAIRKFQNDILILIISKHYYEMLEQLENYGYQEGIHVIKVVNMSRFANNSLSEETFSLYQEKVISGENIYYDIKLKYPEMDYLFILPVKAIGDVFLGAYYAYNYSINRKISNPVFAVTGEVSKKAVLAVGYDKVISFTIEEMDCLERFYLLCPEEYPVMEVNHQKPYTCGLRKIGNYKKIDFASLFFYGIYELEGNIQGRKIEKKQESIIYTEELFIQNNLPESNTVILAPYAKAASKIEMKFWECLANALKEEGYTVCTNVASKEETAVPGTYPLAFSLEYAKDVLEMAGYFIGLRSGFCDLVSQAKCKKIIFYPDRVYTANKFIDFFSLANMGLADDVTEIVFCSERQQEILKQILQSF
ncbi:MAG: hypothetical protein K1W24_01050 [Lachnospiraceae bacterium]